MKTKTAWLTFACKEKITCTTTGEKIDGKVIWRGTDGKPYELKCARAAKIWAFDPYNEEFLKEIKKF